ncbi:MAG TPA: glycoside hydrolase family 3 C-terminal domain-containing protein [Acidimicrobiales bacterium]|nr:glycoside hydrolase family 3 C-terminal domain-containing protein [Acidimicrobiales bacterium]
MTTTASVEELVASLTTDEKVSLLAGTDWWHTAAVDRVGIPPLKMSDGPAGVRGAHVSGGPASASFPCGTALGATWDVDLLRRVGVALAAELASKGAHLILAPTVNLHRTPLAGRNFECYSEDPYLTARLAVAYIEGVQSAGVGATVKHFVANDSEYERMTISSEVPERALRELYLLPFEAAVREAGTWAIMSAYNKVGGTWCSENPQLLTTILRDEWGFDGLVVSDWFGTHSTVDAAVAGLDLEMPGPSLHRGAKLAEAVASGEVPADVLDERVRRVLQLASRTGVLAGTASDPTVERHDDDPATVALLREAAASSIVLLKNEGGLLPLAVDSLSSVAVIGPTAANASTQGGGSAQVLSPYEVSPLEGLRWALGERVNVTFEPGATITRGAARIDPTRLGGGGFLVEYFAGGDARGEPVRSEVTRRSWFRWDRQFEPAGPGSTWSFRATATYTAAFDGEHAFSVRSASRVRLWVGDAVHVDGWAADDGRRTLGGRVSLAVGETVELRLEYTPVDDDLTLDFRVLEPIPSDLADRAVAAAASADVVVVVVGLDSTWETEGRDRAGLLLSGGQAALVERVAAANPRTVVVVNTGAPVEMDWVDKVPAVVQLWYPGQEGGNALADVLTGAVNPGGKLPTTFPRQLSDIPAMLNYPGERGQVHYGEGLFIGYRAFDRMGVAPRFGFGHGLSYTSFSYGPVVLSSPSTGAGGAVTVEVEVTNTGSVAGVEVVQLYVCDPEATVIRPDKELKGFARLSLAAGATGTATFVLDDRSLAFWDPAAHGWVVEPGRFEVLVAASATDVRGRAELTWS